MSTSFHATGLHKTGKPRICMLPAPHDRFNLNVGNAGALLGLLGVSLHGTPYDPAGGEIPMWEARRAVLAARARFDRHARKFVCQAIDAGGQGGQARHVEPAFTEGDLWERLERFAAFVHAAIVAEATSIHWG